MSFLLDFPACSELHSMQILQRSRLLLETQLRRPLHRARVPRDGLLKHVVVSLFTLHRLGIRLQQCLLPGGGLLCAGVVKV